MASKGVGWGGAACAAAHPATGGGSRQSHRRWFGRLEQEDHRLKKHYGCWMDIVRSLELESFMLKKRHGHWINIQRSLLLESFVD